MPTTDPELPTTLELQQRRITICQELHAGKQSRVFDALLGGRRVALKLTDARFVDSAALTARLDAIESLAAACGEVVSPIRIDGAMVQPIGDWLAAATPFIDGRRLDASRPTDAERLGRALARLHCELARLPVDGFPPVVALDVTGIERGDSRWQPLHGDFSEQNVIVAADGLRIIDFDDGGSGPIEYDLANSLYMELFDSEVNKRPDRYETFRPAFLRGYGDESGQPVNELEVDAMISVRIEALGLWLADLSKAPIGIRTSSPAWLDTLATFVRSHA